MFCAGALDAFVCREAPCPSHGQRCPRRGVLRGWALPWIPDKVSMEMLLQVKPFLIFEAPDLCPDSIQSLNTRVGISLGLVVLGQQVSQPLGNFKANLQAHGKFWQGPQQGFQ